MKSYTLIIISIESGVSIVSMHVAALDGTPIVVNPKFKTWKASVDIQVLDVNAEVVANTLVSGVWSGSYASTASCTTDAMGMCTVLTSTIKVLSPVTFTVTDLTAVGYTYEPTVLYQTSVADPYP